MTRNPVLMAACAAVIALVLVADAAGVVVVTSRNRAHVPRELKTVLPTLKTFVERSRGLSFTRDVDISLLDDQAFDRAQGGSGPLTVDPARQYLESQFLVGFLKALSLVGTEFQLSSLNAPAARSLLGVYDPIKKRIVVRATLPEPLLRRVVVHELTHALDDQHFPLTDVVIDLRTEEGRALQALLEGDAVRVDNLYRDQLPPADKVAAEGAVEPLTAIRAIAGPFLDLLAFPYVAGPDFVRALVTRGGSAALDEAFRARPATSEDVLHPDRFLRALAPVFVPEPPADGPLLGLGVLGELGLRLVLGETLDAPSAARAADGWGGDHFVAWPAGGRTCVRVNLRMDTPTDTSEVRDALRLWAARHPGTDIRPEGEITRITRCA